MDLVANISNNIKNSDESEKRISERLYVLWFINTSFQINYHIPEEYFNALKNILNYLYQ